MYPGMRYGPLINSRVLSNSVTKPIQNKSAGTIKILEKETEPLIANSAIRNRINTPMAFIAEKISGRCEKPGVRMAMIACVLNTDGTTEKYHHVNTIIAENEMKKTFPKRRSASFRKAFTLCVPSRNAIEIKAPRANARAARKSNCGRKLGLKNADRKLLSHGQPSDVSMKPNIPVIKKAEETDKTI